MKAISNFIKINFMIVIYKFGKMWISWAFWKTPANFDSKFVFLTKPGEKTAHLVILISTFLKSSPDFDVKLELFLKPADTNYLN